MIAGNNAACGEKTTGGNRWKQVHGIATIARMALVTIAGYPSSGKTRRADQIKADLEQRFQSESCKLKVVTLSDDTLNLSRDSYGGELAKLSHLSRA